ncbi:Hypothetical predicted protein [Mytilus galloprovincialis]|nr:Hypothetical predicted protein [Mytilus galloprovincialis]
MKRVISLRIVKDLYQTDHLVWDLLWPRTRTNDNKMRQCQTSVVRGATYLSKVVNRLDKILGKEDTQNKPPELEGILDDCMDSHAKKEICLARREVMKPDVKGEYSHLFNKTQPFNKWLFGGDVSKTVKDIGECNSDRKSISQGVQFVGGTGPHEGTVEINVNGEWGTICGSYFDMNDAEVICRMAGYSRALQAYSNAHFGPGNGSVILSTLKCSGNENIIDSCGSDGWYKTGTCAHSTDAGVVCLRHANKYTTEGIRLVGGAGPFEGRVELNINGQWGTICDNSFDLPDAEVICKMAGYSR